MVNSHPLNGAALASWVKAATVAASVALTATVDATCVRGGTASLTGGATVSATAIRVLPGACTVVGQATGAAYSWYQGSGEALLVGRATALAACERTINAEASGTATATGSAIAESEIGEVIAAADFTIEAEATRNRPGTAVLVAGATVDPPAVVFGQTVTLTAGSTARAEASVQFSGEGFWRHDGYAEADATGVLSQQVTWSIQSVPLGMGFTIAPEATRQRPAAATMTVLCQGTVTGLGGVPGEVDALAWMTGEATGTRVHGAWVTGSASATYRIAVPPYQNHAASAAATTRVTGSSAPSQTFAGRVTTSTQASGLATGTRVKPGAATATAQLAAIVGSGLDYPGAVNAEAGATAIPVEPATQHYAEAVATLTTLEVSATQARSNPSLVYLYAFGNVAVTSVNTEVGSVVGLTQSGFTTITLAAQHYAACAGHGSLTVTENSQYLRGGAVSATAGLAVATTTATSHRGQASAIARLLFEPVIPAVSHKGVVQATLVSQGEARGGRLYLATVSAALTATCYAVGTQRGDFNAPPERSIFISYEPRGMIVPEAERTLWVPA